MVHNFVRDMAIWACEAGIPAAKWYSHQIPGDYLFGTSPTTTNYNPRYWTSGSPLWSADTRPYGSPGATIYDVKVLPEYNPTEFFRTTKYGLDAISQMGDNWAALEYDAEAYPVGMGVAQSPPEDILEQFLRLYSYAPHVVNFWRWWDGGEHRIKGMNKEPALRDFVEVVRDLGRRTDLDAVYDPPGVAGISAEFNGANGTVDIDIEPKIWDGHGWEWKDWGDFDYFEIHRSAVPGFIPSPDTLIGTTQDYLYQDGFFTPQTVQYYRAVAVNVNGVRGAFSDEVKPSAAPSFCSVR
jgi:hypothetical protein